MSDIAMAHPTGTRPRSFSAAQISGGAATRPGFTITEMLLVIGIILVLAVAVTPVLLQMNRGRSLRDAGRIVQATLVGARDRALSQGRPVGVRFVPVADGESLVRTLIFTRFQSAYSAGSAQIVRAAGPTGDSIATVAEQSNPTSALQTARIVLLHGDNSVTWAGFAEGLIRFENSGQFYSFTRDVFNTVDARKLLLRQPLAVPNYNPLTAINSTSAGQFERRLKGFEELDPNILINGGPTTANDIPLPAELAISKGLSYQIIRNSVPLEGNDPVVLPAGIAIDLGIGPDPDFNNRLSRILPVTDPVGPWEIMFAPNGQVIPPQNQIPYVGLWLREEATPMGVTVGQPGNPYPHISVSTRDTSSHLLVVVNTMTGFVTTVKPRFENNLPAGAVDDQWDWQAYYNDVTRGQERGL